MTAGPDEVRVAVLILVERDLPPGTDWLDESERATLDGLVIPKRRADWLLGRWTAKRAAGAFLGIDPAGVAVRAAPDGAPGVLVDGRSGWCVISITHRAGVAACAVAADGLALGCDLELVEPRSEGFVADYLTEFERALVEASGPTGLTVTANLLWSAKEAVLKAARTGLRADARDVEVRPEAAAGEGWVPFVARMTGDPNPWTGRWMRTGDHLLTLVVRSLATPSREPAVAVTSLA
jgi:4'-phosphopantetheinyl transferase